MLRCAKGVPSLLRTDRAIRVMKTRVFSIWKPRKELERFPLDAPVTVVLSADDSGGVLDIGSHRLYFRAFAVDDAKAIGSDMARCWRAFTYQPDQVAVFKLAEVSDKLLMYRTDGVAFPETAEFHR